MPASKCGLVCADFRRRLKRCPDTFAGGAASLPHLHRAVNAAGLVVIVSCQMLQGAHELVGMRAHQPPCMPPRASVQAASRCINTLGQLWLAGSEWSLVRRPALPQLFPGLAHMWRWEKDEAGRLR